MQIRTVSAVNKISCENLFYDLSNEKRCANIIASESEYNFVRRKTMPRVIGDDCIQCGACADTCPVGAIAEGDSKYVVDPEQCIDCGACEDGCPVGAIKEA